MTPVFQRSPLPHPLAWWWWPRSPLPFHRVHLRRLPRLSSSSPLASSFQHGRGSEPAAQLLLVACALSRLTSSSTLDRAMDSNSQSTTSMAPATISVAKLGRRRVARGGPRRRARADVTASAMTRARDDDQVVVVDVELRLGRWVLLTASRSRHARGPRHQDLIAPGSVPRSMVYSVAPATPPSLFIFTYSLT